MNTGLGTLSTESLLRLWNTRPVRASDSGQAAGVCTGIARRYKVDPTLVKVAFVVATLFGGSGLFVYILAWITFPAGGDAAGARWREQREEFRAARDSYRRNRRHMRRSGRSAGHGGARHTPSGPPTIVLIVIVVVILATTAPNIAWGSGGLVGPALLLLGWWLLYQRCPDADPGTSADTIGTTPIVATETFTRWMPKAWADNVTAATTSPTAAASTTQQGGVDLLKNDTAPTDVAPVTPPTPPAWDPLGAAPFAWDLPEPSSAPAPVPVRRQRSALTPITLGVAVVAAAIATAANLAGIDVFSPARIIALALAVVSAGLIVGALSRRGSGLAPVAVVLAVAVVVISAAGHLGSIPGGGAGDRDWRPLTESDIASTYELSVGSGTLDLRSVTLTGDRSVRIRIGIGEAKILAPAGMNLKTKCRTAIGEEKCRSGVDGGSDGRSGPVLDIDASSIVGQVEVSRG